MSNTSYLDDGQFTVVSAISANGSRATVQGANIVATSNLSAAAQTLTGALTAVGGTFSSAITGSTFVFGTTFVSSSTTAQSGATAKLTTQGQLYFSVLSLTSNGGEFGFRSGNTVYRFASVAVG